MSGNTFGQLFAVTNFGESHGPAIGCVIDGCPPGLALSEADIQPDLDRRRPGTSRFVTQRNEPDAVEILSGVFEGQTTGTPICLLIKNTDQRSKDYSAIVQTFRPGHADYTYFQKYGIRDPRGGGRSSARLTAPMVAAGAVAKKWLFAQYGTVVRGCMQQLGDLPLHFEAWEHVANNVFFAPMADVSALETYVDTLRKSGDSCGARIRVMASGVPVGLGQPLFDKMDADIAYAMMGINAVKGVEIGAGFGSVSQRGSNHGAGRHQQRARPGGIDSHQAHQLHPQAAQLNRHGWPAHRGGHQGPPRPLRGHSGNPDCRGHAGAGDHGACAAPPGPMRRCAQQPAFHCRERRHTTVAWLSKALPRR